MKAAATFTKCLIKFLLYTSHLMTHMLKYLYIKLLNKTLLVLCVLSTFEVSLFCFIFLNISKVSFFKSNQIDTTLEELAETSFKMLKIEKK